MSAIMAIDISSKQTGNKKVNYVGYRKEERKERKEESSEEIKLKKQSIKGRI